MSNKGENDLTGLNLDELISAEALDPNLVGPTLSTIPSFTLPTGPTGVTGQVLLELLKVVFVIAVFYLCKMFYNNLLGKLCFLALLQTRQTSPLFSFYLLLLP
ncbi:MULTISPECIES: exosporium leader peptide-containing protein [Bacillus cereus group]|uniref:exosporium leader peptide-containing protein n=1 Tax=Bacillus cereus group TaxID=86661 RepID=UPI003564833B